MLQNIITSVPIMAFGVGGGLIRILILVNYFVQLRLSLLYVTLKQCDFFQGKAIFFNSALVKHIFQSVL